MIMKFKDFDIDKVTVVEYNPKSLLICEYLDKKLVREDRINSESFDCYDEYNYYYEDMIEELMMNNEFLGAD